MSLRRRPYLLCIANQYRGHTMIWEACEPWMWSFYRVGGPA